MLRSWWLTTCQGIIVPAGIIVPYMDIVANIPEGWKQFTAATRAIKGGGSAGLLGGTSSFAVSTSAAGSHAGGTAFQSNMGNASAGGNGRTTMNAVGQHSHGATAYYNPATHKYVFIKSSDEQSKFPVNTGILSDVLRPDLTDVTETGSLLGATGTIESFTAQSKSVGGTPEGGNHHHMNGFGAASNNGTTVSSNSGSYMGAHSFGEAAVADNIRRFYLGLWTSATKQIAVATGMYAMWESVTPPDNWSICDGANGTPYLTDYFIGFDVAKIGTQEGNGQVTISATSNSKGHRHNWGTNTNGINENGVHSSSPPHNHTVNSTVAFEPYNYTLIFIKYTG